MGAALSLMKVVLMYGRPELRMVKDKVGGPFLIVEYGVGGLFLLYYPLFLFLRCVIVPDTCRI